MSGSLVRQPSSTTTPPRSPTARPASRASWSRGRTPAEKTTTSRSSSVPLARVASSRPASRRIEATEVPRCTVTLRSSIISRSRAPPPSSTCSGMSRGAISTTCGDMPSRRSARAASRPSRPAADHQAGPPAASAHGRALRRGADRVQVVEGAVDEASGQVPARDRRDERVGAGGQHQRVVAEGAAVAGGDGAGGPVDGGHRLVQVQRVAGRVVAALSDDIEVSGGDAVDIRRQRDPVVGAARLLRQHGNPPRPARITVPHGLDKPLADHPVAGNDEMALLVLHTGLPHALTTSHSGAPPCQAQ